jgi:hypothetical protein
LLPEATRLSLLENLSDEERAHLAYRWHGWLARPAQEPPPGEWRFWLIMAGRGFGKTRIGAEETRAAAKRIEFPNIIGATADDARDIMIEGESGILAVCPPWERPDYRPSKRQLLWPNGAKTLIFTADEPERLRGKQHEWLWADEVAAWRYPDSWDQAMFGLRLGDNPQAVVTTTPKPTLLVRELVSNPYTVVTRGSTYDNVDNLAPAFADEIIRKYEGTRLGRQELLGELLEDEGLAYRFSEQDHTLPSFELPDAWERFESMDWGYQATAWLAYAVDHEGNVYVFDEFYESGMLPSEMAPRIHEKRRRWHPGGHPICYADPSVFNNKAVTNRWGKPATIADEFSEQGITLQHGNNDRCAGYVRISERLRLVDGKPSLFIFDRCTNLIDQLRYAPVEEENEPHPGEAVSRRWEGPHGHAHAALRYGVLSWPGPTPKPLVLPEDPRAATLARYEASLERKSARRRYQNV